MTKTVLTDVDHTLVNFSEAFTDWAAARGHIGTGKLCDVYRIEEFLGCDGTQAAALVAEFTEDETFSRLPAEPYAVEVVRDLHARGWEFVAITACADTPRVAAWRRHNLETLFGFPWRTIHLAGIDQCKRDFLSRYAPTVWVEDSFDHAVAGAEIGHRSFLLDHPYNGTQHHPEVTRVADWRDVRAAIL